MASTPIAVTTRHFDGGSRVDAHRARPGDPLVKDLASILRNVAEEFSDLAQSGAAAIPDAAQEVTVSFSPAMPDTNYDVVVTFRETPVAALVGAVDLKGLFVPDADKAVSGFKVKVAPVVNTAGAFDFYWSARHRSNRLITKG